MKIFIIGTSGSGKSTLARKLAAFFTLKHIELDNLGFLPGWVQRPSEDFVRDVLQAIKSLDWVACGNYRQVTPLLMKEADVIIWLNYPLLPTLWRTLRRSIRRIVNKEPCCNVNYETFRMQFMSKYSVFLWVLRTYHRRKKSYTVLAQDPAFHPKWITLSNKDEWNRLLGSCSRYK